MNARFAPGGRERILEEARMLTESEKTPEEAERLLDGVTQVALNHCRREDVPESMEWPLSLLLARVLEGEGLRPVSTVKRGDTAITYGAEPLELETLLAPFVRLASPEGGRRHG